jgi:acyl-CoA synthetase (NDP forming)
MKMRENLISIHEGGVYHMNNQKELIDNFLKFRRVAFIGVSRNPKDFTRNLWSQFRAGGYDAIPVHREQTTVDGVQCYSNVKAINPKPECALILTPKNGIIPALEDCLAAGVRLVWVFGINGAKDVSDDVLVWCELHNMNIIAGYCPYMFLPDMSFIHRCHGAVWKMIGYYPR